MVLFGEKKISYDKKKVNILQQSFYIIQNIKLDNLEESFLKNFKNYTKESSNSNLYLSTISELARPLMESLLILVVFIIIFIFYYYFDLPKEQIIPMLGLYIFAMFRILPSCNKILSCYNNIRYHESIIKDFNETLELEDYDNNDFEFIGEFSFQKNIFLKNIDYVYQDGIKVLNNVNFEIKKNQSIGIFGESGSGKSTLLNVISNLLLPSQGEILIDGKKLKLPSKKLQSKIGYVPQKAYLIDDTIISNIIL